MPVGIKDLVAVAGMPMPGGSPAYRDFVPDEDDIVVERLRGAGAIVLGKTAVTEFGYSGASHSPVGETTRNPWNLERTSGGSSAGSGAAVAAGIGPVAIAADGGGSIRIPASFCGLFGMKASMGRVPMYPSCRDERYPGIASWEGLEHVGPVSRTVADSALVLSVIAGPDPRDRHSIPAGDVDWRASAAPGDLRGLRVAFSADLGRVAVDPEVARVVAEAAGAFADLGCEVVAADPSFPDPGAAFAALIALESDLRGMREIVDRHGHEMSPHLVDLITRAVAAEDVHRRARRPARPSSTRCGGSCATTTCSSRRRSRRPPFPVHMQGPERVGGRYVRDTAWLSFTYPFNLTGQPAATVPAGFTRRRAAGRAADRRRPPRRRPRARARPRRSRRPARGRTTGRRSPGRWRRDARGPPARRGPSGRLHAARPACGMRRGRPAGSASAPPRAPPRARSSARPPRATPPRSAASSPPARTSTGARPTAAPPSRPPPSATTSRPPAR